MSHSIPAPCAQQDTPHPQTIPNPKPGPWRILEKAEPDKDTNRRRVCGFEVSRFRGNSRGGGSYEIYWTCDANPDDPADVKAKGDLAERVLRIAEDEKVVAHG